MKLLSFRSEITLFHLWAEYQVCATQQMIINNVQDKKKGVEM